MRKSIIDDLKKITSKKLPKKKKGGKIQNPTDLPEIVNSDGKIIVNDKFHPRLRSYQDSLALFNNSIELQKELDKFKYEPVERYKTGKIGGGTLHPQTEKIYKKMASEGNFDGLNDQNYIEERNKKGYDIKKEEGSLYSMIDVLPQAINPNFKVRNLVSANIAPIAMRLYEDTSDKKDRNYTYAPNISFYNIDRILKSADVRQVWDYSNVKPKQEVVYIPKKDNKIENKSDKSIPKEKPKKNNRKNMLQRVQPIPSRLNSESFEKIPVSKQSSVDFGTPDGDIAYGRMAGYGPFSEKYLDKNVWGYVGNGYKGGRKEQIMTEDLLGMSDDEVKSYFTSFTGEDKSIDAERFIEWRNKGGAKQYQDWKDKKNIIRTPKKSYGGSILSNAGSMAATGFTIGGPIGAGIGAGIGGVLGLLQEKAKRNELAKQKQLEDEAVRKEQLFLNRQNDRQIMSNFPTYGVNQSYFAKGGNVTPQYEAEDEEVIQFNPLDKPKVHDTGYLQQHSSTTATIKGKSHEQGGEDMSGGERIFSDKIYFNAKKDADIIKALRKTLKNL